MAGAIDEEKVVLESLGSIKRAGADLIFQLLCADLAGKIFCVISCYRVAMLPPFPRLYTPLFSRKR